MRVIVTRPQHDVTTRYLSSWAGEIIDLAKKKGIDIYDLLKEKANKDEFEGRINKIKPDIFRLWNQSGGASLIIKVLNNKNISVRLENVGRTYSVLQSIEPFESFPIDQWVKVKIKVKVSDTAGTITIWQNDKIIMQALGLDTLSTGKPWNQARWGVYANQSNASVYWDDLALGNTDPDRSAAIDVIGDNNTVSNFNFFGGLLSVSGYNNSIVNNSFNNSSSTVVASAGNFIGRINFTTGKLSPNTYYEVSVDNATSSSLISGSNCSGSRCLSDSEGNLNFTFNGAGVIAHLFELKAWQTIARISSSYFQAGDKLLIKNGEAWREALIIPYYSDQNQNSISNEFNLIID
ncbi:MAG: heparin lyase I family protein [Candidatus Buchananbacteria bacterium]|jgi:hypothetical protein